MFLASYIIDHLCKPAVNKKIQVRTVPDTGAPLISDHYRHYTGLSRHWFVIYFIRYHLPLLSPSSVSAGLCFLFSMRTLYVAGQHQDLCAPCPKPRGCEAEKELGGRKGNVRSLIWGLNIEFGLIWSLNMVFGLGSDLWVLN